MADCTSAKKYDVTQLPKVTTVDLENAREDQKFIVVERAFRDMCGSAIDDIFLEIIDSLNLETFEDVIESERWRSLVILYKSIRDSVVTMELNAERSV